MIKNWLRQKLRASKFIKKIYNWVKFESTQTITSVPEITSIFCSTTDINKMRINLLVPSISKEHIFGGISTALKFFEQFYKFENVDFRIIVTDAIVTQEDMANFPVYELILATDDIHGKVVTDISNRANLKLAVRSTDIFIATAWWSAFCGLSVIKWQSETYEIKKHSLIYFIQDYEPGFYPFSSRYLLADSTYDNNSIAVFNTSLLKDFFINQGYTFRESYFFEPKIHPKLYNYLVDKKQVKKERLIFIYGRPDVARNCFEIIIQGIFKWVSSDINAGNWKIISAGTKHEDINLPNGNVIISKGKLELDEYAALLSRTYLGISLMASPHPSYPPLDLAAFGAKVITNSFKNKDLSKLNSKITSIEIVTPEQLADNIQKITSQYESDSLVNFEIDSKNEYLTVFNEFAFVEEMYKHISYKRE